MYKKTLLFFIVLNFSFIFAEAPEDTAKQIIKKYQLEESTVALREVEGWQKPQKIIVRVDSKERLNWMKEVASDVELIGVSSAKEALSEMSDVQALLGFCNTELIKNAKQLQWIQVYWAGVERCLENTELISRKIMLTNAKRLSGAQIAEHAIALMFSLTRGLDENHLDQQKSLWNNDVFSSSTKVWELSGRTLLVVGLGGIGTEIAQRGHALGMNVIATRNSSRRGPDFVSYVGLADELLTLASQADVVINALPLTPSTTGMFDRKFFKSMKNSAYFISIGRGKSTVTADLLAALKSGELSGAGLDVTDPEPLPADHPLWKQPRVIITPHIAWRSEKYSKRRWILIRENLRRYIAGEALLSEVDLVKGY
ncbi:MAG: phosphoglycerate dehydrogenase-like enzyme [Enterobacterales bacterium]|jgi:phosphoglycerate dehydrogenase-like enzyme